MSNATMFMLLFSWAPLQVSAQSNKPGSIAPFEITLTNGQIFKATALKKNTPVILVYFAPDCDHCHAFVKELMNNLPLLKKKQVVLASYFPLPAVNSFDKEYNISSHENIKIGTEGMAFIVRHYYGIQRFPFIVMYNREGAETKRFITETPFAVVKTALLKLH